MQGRGRLGNGAGDVQEVRLLNRVIRWTPQGLLYEADPRHAEQLARDLERFGEETVRSPLTRPGLRRGAEAVEAATLWGKTPRISTGRWRPGPTTSAWIARTLRSR